MFTVDVFNEDGSYLGARLDIPDHWCDFYEKTPSYEIVRAHLKIANRGLDIIDAVPIPLCAAMGKTPDEDQAVGVVNYDFTKQDEWVDTMEYTQEEKDFFADFDISIKPRVENPITPIGSLQHGTKTSFADISPEVEMFDNTPLAVPIKSAIKYATICKSNNEDPSDFLRQVERWWNMEDGTLDMINVPEIADISYPRVAGSSSKNSSPIYGMDNFAGRVSIEHTGLTRESFLTEKESDDGYFAVSDFGRFNAFMRYVMGLSVALPGRSRNALLNKKGRIGFAVSPNYAFKYKKEDFIVKIPKGNLPIINVGKAAKPIVEYLGSDEYLRHLISIYAKIDVDEDYTFSGVDVKKQLYDLKKRIFSTDPKPMIMAFDDLLPEISIQPKFIPNIPVKKEFSSIVISQIGTVPISDPIVSGAVGSFINLISDSKHEYSEKIDIQIKVCNALSIMFSEGAKLAIRKHVSTNYHDSKGLCSVIGASPIYTRDSFENIVHSTLVVNYKGVIVKVYEFQSTMSLIYVKEMEMGKVNPDVLEVKGIADALKSWSAYYASKSWKLTDNDTDESCKKVVMYSALSRIFSKATFESKKRKLTWPNITDELVRKASNYAHKTRKKFVIDCDPNSVKDVGKTLDKQLEPRVSFEDLGLCIEAALDQFEYDLLSRKMNFDPAEPDIMPKIWKPKAAVVESESVKLVLTEEMLELINYTDKKVLEIKTAMANRDIYDMFLERANTLSISKDTALNWLAEKHDTDLYTIDDARKANIPINLDDLAKAAEEGEIELDLFESNDNFETGTFDDDDDPLINDDDVI